MTADGLSPEREERLIGEMLRERAGIDPGRLGPVIDLAALGLVNSAPVGPHLRVCDVAGYRRYRLSAVLTRSRRDEDNPAIVVSCRGSAHSTEW